MREIRVEVEDEQYDRLKAVKDANGLTWRGLLLRGAKGLDSDGPLRED